MLSFTEKLHGNSLHQWPVRIWGLVGLFALCCFAIAWMTPLIGDDWGKNVTYSWESTVRQIHFYNGRHLANALVPALKSFPLARFLLESLVLTCLLVFTAAVTARGTLMPILLLAMVLILGVPQGIYREVYFWMSGFVNFAIPPVVLAAYLYFSRDDFTRPPPQHHSWMLPLGGALGFFTQMFAEHTSILAVAMGLAINIYCYMRYKRLYGLHVAFLIGATLGCALMFLSPCYWNGQMGRLQGKDWLQFSSLERLFFSLRHGFFQDLTLNNVLLNSVIASGLIIRLILQKHLRAYLPITLLSVAMLLILLRHLLSWVLPFQTEVAMGTLFLLAVGIAVTIGYQRPLRDHMLFYFSGGIFAALPLLQACSIGPRCYLISYVLFMLLGLTIIADLLPRGRTRITVGLAVLCGLGAAGLMGKYLVVAICNHQHYYSSMAGIRAQLSAGKSSILLSRYPFEHYLHDGGVPERPYHVQVYKAYYGIPEETELQLIPHGWRISPSEVSTP